MSRMKPFRVEHRCHGENLGYRLLDERVMALNAESAVNKAARPRGGFTYAVAEPNDEDHGRGCWKVIDAAGVEHLFQFHELG